MDTSKRDAIVACVVRAQKVADKAGRVDIRGCRWLDQVVERLQTIGLSFSDLWAAHCAGVITLSRCDLAQCYDADRVVSSEVKHGIGVFNFVRIGR